MPTGGIAVVFALRTFHHYPHSSEPFTVLTDQQAFPAAFVRTDVHGPLACWLDFLSEYDFEIWYPSEYNNKALDFLSCVSHGETGADGIEEGDLVSMMLVDCAVESIISQLEPALQDVVRHLSGSSLGNKLSNEKAGIRRLSVRYVQWEVNIYKREKKMLLVVVHQPEREKLMRTFHDELGH